MATESEVLRAAENLRSCGWDTVLARWFAFETPNHGLDDEGLERVALAYLQSIARDALNDGRGDE